MNWTPNEIIGQMQHVSLFREVKPEILEGLFNGGVVQQYGPGEIIYKTRDHGNSMFLLLQGSVALNVVRRGDTLETRVADVFPGQTFGEDAVLGDGRREFTAVATNAVTVLELFRAPIQQAFKKDALKPLFEREKERHRRKALFDRLRQTSYLKTLPAKEVEALSERISLRAVARGEKVYNEGDPAERFHLIGEGMVKVARKVGNMEHVRAYLSAGDFFGDIELMDGTPRSATITAMSPVELLELPRDAFLELHKRFPELGNDLRRLSREYNKKSHLAVQALPNLGKQGDRLMLAQSLLLIDLEDCIRCGNCAWSCEQNYGNSRLVRRGETVNRVVEGKAASPILLPNSCQHCTDAACMAGCPTGAISRDIDGEVFVRDQVCIGCGDCAKRCPWGNISMVDLPEGAPHRQRAVKCDNCRNFAVSACVHNCPTGAMKRVDPLQHFPELRSIFDRESGEAAPTPPPREQPWKRALVPLALMPGLPVVGALAYGLTHTSELRGGSAFGIVCGLSSVGLMSFTGLYAGRKRLIKWVMQLNPRKSDKSGEGAARLQKEPNPVSIHLRYWLPAHIVTGASAFLLVLLHAGFIPEATLTAMLMALFAFVIVTGIFGTWAYQRLPRLLTHIEGSPKLLEDIDEEKLEILREREELAQGRPPAYHQLIQQMQQELGSSSWLFRIFREAMTEAPLIRAVKEVYRPHFAQMGNEHRAALERTLEGLCKERHLTAQWVVHRVMRVWLVPHILASIAMTLLLALHLWQVLFY